MNEMTTGVLELLRGIDGFVSGQRISEQLGISRTAIEKHIRQLRNAGYYIESSSGSGYRLRFSPDLPSEMEIQPFLNTDIIGQRIHFHDEVESTNDLASELAHDGEPEGTVVIADEQTAGKGRLDRSWVSPSGLNLYLSVILRPPVAPWEALQMSIVTVVSVVRAIEIAAKDTEIGIKWPNDVMCGGRKVAGILCELYSDMDRVHHLVTGIGINVNMKDLGGELVDSATSLLIETGRNVSRPLLAGTLLNELERAYSHWLGHGLADFIPFWEDHSVLSGRTVGIETASGHISGIVRGLTMSGGLEIEDVDGNYREILAGDVHIASISSE
jgi:BirA family biotin operon repressor/biotin-[acetyl-CoA-carboxylase] ligase